MSSKIIQSGISSLRSNQSDGPNWAREMSLNNPGGAYGMDILSSVGLYDNKDQNAINAYHNARDPGELKYVRNPNLWCASLVPQLTCCSIYSDDCGTLSGNGQVGSSWRHRYGLVAITKRHALGCGHAFIHAQGTYNSGNLTSNPPTRRRFIEEDGSSVDAVQISQINALTLIPQTDLSVCTFDEDLPEGIYIPRVVNSLTAGMLRNWDILSLSQEWHAESGAFFTETRIGNNNSNTVVYKSKAPGEQGYGINIIHVISGSGSSVISIDVTGLVITITAGSTTTVATAISAVNSNSPASALVTAFIYGHMADSGFIISGNKTLYEFGERPSDYPLLNRSMFHSFKGPFYNNDKIDKLRYNEWGGDSGTPTFVKFKDELVLSGVVSGGQSDAYPQQGVSFAQKINQLIALSDAHAISLGRMVNPTGYTVTEYK